MLLGDAIKKFLPARVQPERMMYVAEKAGHPGSVLFPVDEDWSGGADISGTAGVVAQSRVECFEGSVVTATSFRHRCSQCHVYSRSSH